MQKRDLLVKLAQARLAQARAMQRFAEAQARIAQLEAGLHASSAPPKQAALDSHTPDFLPASGDLELLGDFIPPPQTDQEETERFASLPTPDIQIEVAPGQIDEETARSPRVRVVEGQL